MVPVRPFALLRTPSPRKEMLKFTLRRDMKNRFWCDLDTSSSLILSCRRHMASFRALVLVLLVTGEQLPPTPSPPPPLLPRPPLIPSTPVLIPTSTSFCALYAHTPTLPPQPHCSLPPSTSGSPSAVSPAVLTSASTRPAARARPSSSPLRLRASRSVSILRPRSSET